MIASLLTTGVLGRICQVLSLILLLLSKPIVAADEYDYIVVGSGPGGGTLASNLAREGYTVLLVEAGDSSVGSGGQYPPQITWDFFVKHYTDSERQNKYSHLTFRKTDGSYWVGRDGTQPAGAKLLGVYYPRGSTVGGSSMINQMVTFLPPDSDWNYIVNITGDQSWSAANMRSIFTRIEHNNYLPKGSAGHGFDGFFQVSMAKASNVQNPGLAVLNAAAATFNTETSQVTAKLNTDPNGPEPNRDQATGIFGPPSHTKTNGQRFSSRDYIQDTINAKFNLTLSINSLVTKVLFNTTQCAGKPRATGVEFLQGKSIYKADPRFNANNKGTVKQATAKKEVIISGGAFNTPQILMLSGIGPAEQLKQFNIPLLVDLPGVGRNMQDNQEMPTVGQFPRSGSGSGGGCIMLKTKHAPYDERDILVFHGPFVFRGFWPSNQTNTALPNDPVGVYGMSMVRMHPQNKAGTVKLTSSNPQDMPDINFNLFAEGKDTDMGAMKDVVAWARGVYGAIQSPTGPVKVIEPACASPDSTGSCGKTDEDWITAQTFGHHPTSTAAIGADNDPMAVLDSRFRVRGVAGLRVVDASTFPRIPGVFPVVATFMVGQKGSDVVIEDGKKPDVC